MRKVIKDSLLTFSLLLVALVVLSIAVRVISLITMSLGLDEMSSVLISFLGVLTCAGITAGITVDKYEKERRGR